MEKLIKSTNGQWKLMKVADEVKNRRAEQASRMAEQGQGDVKGNTSESIYNIPKEPKDFNPHIHLYHPQAPDELHRMNQEEWLDHFKKMLDSKKLNDDQIGTLRSENKRRQNVIELANKEKSKKPSYDPRARKKGESSIDYRARMEKDFGALDRMSPEDREKFRQEFDLSAEALAEREAGRKQQQTENQRLIDEQAAKAQKIKQQQFEDARDSMMKSLPFSDKNQMNAIYKRIISDPSIADRFLKYLHIVHEVRPDGSVANISFHPKGHEKEKTADFVSSMRGDDAPYTENSFLGLEDTHPHLFPESSKPLVLEQPALSATDNIPHAGVGVGLGEKLTEDQKRNISAFNVASRSPEEQEKAREISDENKKKDRRALAEAKIIQQQAEKYK